MKKRTKQERYFAVCINNKKYEASLEVGKLYRVIPDEEAESHGYLRVVDESGEDYGYSADRFFRLDVPRPLERALLRACLETCLLPNKTLCGVVLKSYMTILHCLANEIYLELLG